jgi:hypothetical protein
MCLRLAAEALVYVVYDLLVACSHATSRIEEPLKLEDKM